ncbi:MAG: hypothetical protein ACHQUA_00355 [Microgenomates group bacterium]
MGNRLTKLIVLSVITLFAVGVASALILRAQKPQGPEGSKYTYAPKSVKANNQETEVLAPDGKMTLVMKEEKGKESTEYIFSVSSPTGGQKEVYRETINPSGSIQIPYNTFSPDDKYFFLKKVDSGKTSFFVLSTAGTALGKDSPFLEFSSSFETKYPDYKIKDATGWGGMTLIIINTDKVSGGQGPSFWFDVTSNRFIQLSSHF